MIDIERIFQLERDINTRHIEAQLRTKKAKQREEMLQAASHATSVFILNSVFLSVAGGRDA